MDSTFSGKLGDDVANIAAGSRLRVVVGARDHKVVKIGPNAAPRSGPLTTLPRASPRWSKRLVWQNR
jgi:hypothetical protein